jgi:hypothetical protein
MLMLPFRRRAPSTRLPRPKPSRPRLTEIELCAWLAAAESGDRIEYHRGFLAIDRFPLISELSEADRELLSQLASRAYQLAGQDLVHLVQERLGPDHFSYVAVARPKPKHGSASLSTLLLEDAA